MKIWQSRNGMFDKSEGQSSVFARQEVKLSANRRIRDKIIRDTSSDGRSTMPQR